MTIIERNLKEDELILALSFRSLNSRSLGPGTEEYGEEGNHGSERVWWHRAAHLMAARKQRGRYRMTERCKRETETERGEKEERMHTQRQRRTEGTQEGVRGQGSPFKSSSPRYPLHLMKLNLITAHEV